MNIVIDNNSGFCFGVVRAIETAQTALESGHAASLGDIVHNSHEVQRLEKLGLSTIDYKQLGDANAGMRVLIRAHGEPPKTYEMARRLGVEIIDATCPVVAMLQKRVKAAHNEMLKVDGQVVILGKKGHAEVIGLEGQTDNDAIVIENIDDLKKIDFNRPIVVFSQTTQSLELFHVISKEIEFKAKNSCVIHDTICRQVAGRAPHLSEFSKQFDLILFVCGKKSSNGKALYQVCKAANTNSYMIEDDSEINPDWITKDMSIGICGATSTPLWQMKKVEKALKTRF